MADSALFHGAQPFELANLPATPWKNGGGTTREIACWPPGAGLHDFDWRISVATIAAGGPFSAFEGIDRSITLLKGDGVELRGGDWSHQLAHPLAPFAFSGDEMVMATLLGGPSEDFNVMTRRARCRAQVHVLNGTHALPASSGQAVLLLVVQGAWQWLEDSAEPFALPVGHGLWWPPGTLTTSGRLQPVLSEGPLPTVLQVVISGEADLAS